MNCSIKKKPVSKKVFGTSLNYWMLHPLKLSTISLLYFIIICTLSMILKVGWNIDYVDENGIVVSTNGFIKTHWSITYLIIMPLSVILVSIILKTLDKAIHSLDNIIIKDTQSAELFSQQLHKKIMLNYKLWILPMSLIFPVVLTVIADGKDILVPLTNENILNFENRELDWSTSALVIQDGYNSILYFIFNILVFSMQVFLGFCGFIVIFMVSYILSIFVNESFFKDKYSDEKLQYSLKWDYSDVTGRCGLHELDKVYILFVLGMIFSITVASLSVWFNIYSQNGIDIGSLILIIGNLLFFPSALIWILVPYWSKFPRFLPLEHKECPQPKPWPLGNDKIALSALFIATSGWIWLFKQGFESIRKITDTLY